MIRSCGGGEPPPYRSVGNKNVRDAFTHRLHADCANIPRSVASSGGRSPRPRPAVLCPPGPPPRVTWRHRQTWASVPRASQPTHVRRASSVRGVRSPGLVRQCLLGAQPQTPPGGASPPGPPPVVVLASLPRLLWLRWHRFCRGVQPLLDRYRVGLYVRIAPPGATTPDPKIVTVAGPTNGDWLAPGWRPGRA
jgi:hypothetical protein